MLKKAPVCAVSVTVAAGFFAVCPSAAADSVTAPPVAYGDVTVYTFPDNMIAVEVSNVLTMNDNSDPASTLCGIHANELRTTNNYYARLAVSTSGSGSAVVGPLPSGKYSLYVSCLDLTPSGGVIGSETQRGNLFAQEEWAYNPDQPKGSVGVTVDGTPMRSSGPIATVPTLPEFDPGVLVEPIYSGPPVIDDMGAYTSEPDASCSDAIEATYQENQVAGDITEAALMMLRKKSLETSVLQVCALTATNPEEAAQALCRVGKSLVPADWVGLALATGAAGPNPAAEQIGINMMNQWNQQC